MSDKSIISALKIIERYGQIDGAHHKQWCLDQVARHLLSHLGMDYSQWVLDMKAGEDGPETYSYDQGCAP